MNAQENILTSSNRGQVRTEQSSGTFKLQRAILLLDGLFLTLMGGAFAIFDLVSYFVGQGPFGSMLHNDLLAIGFVEAHSLALMLGLLLLRAGQREVTPIWHMVGAAVHLLLGTCNLLFWQLAIEQNTVIAYSVITVIHGLFVIAQIICYLRKNQSRAETR